MKRRIMILYLLIVLLLPTLAHAATYYVSKSGSDSNSCSSAQSPGSSAKLTIEAGVACLSSGDTLEIQAGTYQRTAWTLDVPSGGGSWETATTIKAYQTDEVILTPQDPQQNGTDVIRLPTGRSYIIFDGLILDGLRSGTSNGGRMGFRFDRNATNPNPSHHIRLINMEIRNTYHSNILTNDATHNEFINCNLHRANPNDPNYTGNGPYGIYMSSGDNLVQGCEIHNNNGYGISNYSGHDFWPHNNRFIGNTFHHNGRAGIIISRSTGSRVINNVFYENGRGFVGTSTAGDRHGIMVWGVAHDTIIYNNTVYDNERHGIVLSDNTSGSVVRNNIIYGTSDTFSAVHIHSGSSNNTVTNNLIYHANAGLRVTNAGSGNTIASNINDDPLFVNPATDDYQLQAESPAIDAGVTLLDVTTDILGVPRPFGSAYDMGAYEWTDEIGTGPEFIWSAEAQTGGQWNDSDFSMMTVRQLIRATAITDGATHIRIHARGRSSGAYTISNLRLVERDGSSLGGVDETNTAITWDGQSSITIQPGTTVQSDPVAMTIDAAKDYFATYYGPETLGVWLDGGTVTNAWLADGDVTGTIDWEGVTLNEIGTRNWSYGLTHMEAVSSELAISPITPTVTHNGTVQFSASGGAEPYAFSVIDDTSGGSINSSTGLYTAGASEGTAQVIVTDDNSVTASTIVTIQADSSLAVSVADVSGPSIVWTISPQDEIGVTHYFLYVHWASEGDVTTPTRVVPIPAVTSLFSKDGTGLFNKLSNSIIKLPEEEIFLWVRPYYTGEPGELSPRYTYDNSPE